VTIRALGSQRELLLLQCDVRAAERLMGSLIGMKYCKRMEKMKKSYR
jgi:hypothetical protein